MTETKDITKETPNGLAQLLDETYGLGLHINEENVHPYNRFDIMWGLRELVIRLRPLVDMYDMLEARLNQALDEPPFEAQTHDGSSFTVTRCLREFRVVDVAKLRAEAPDLYEELSYVDAATFKRNFGESRMRNMLRAYLNDEGQEHNPLPFEKVRLDDLIQEIGETGAVQFLKPVRQFGYLQFDKDGKGYPEKYWNPEVNNEL